MCLRSVLAASDVLDLTSLSQSFRAEPHSHVGKLSRGSGPKVWVDDPLVPTQRPGDPAEAVSITSLYQ